MKRAERWKPTPGWPLYEASDQGRIKCLNPDRIIPIGTRGNVYVRGRHSSISAAYLILLAFVGPPPGPYGTKRGCYLARHLNDNRANNELKNLAWGTHKDNITDAMRNGRINTPEHRAKTAAIRKGKKIPAKVRRKMSIARRTRITSEETKEKMRKHWQDKSYRERHLKWALKGTRNRWKDPKQHERQAARMDRINSERRARSS